jgi:[protein-PII] uridylyltransferase
LKFKIGLVWRTPNECIDWARQDLKSRNALLEARHLIGSKALFRTFEKSFSDYTHRHAKTYIKDRLFVQTNRHRTYDDTVFLQEPDIKNGVGGLRDYQNTVWLAHMKLGTPTLQDLFRKKILTKSEYKALHSAYDFLLRVRIELHLQNKRPGDVLTLDKQPLVAYNLGYRQPNIMKRVEAFMRDYYHHAKNIAELGRLVEQRLDTHKTRSTVPAEKPNKKLDGFWIYKNHISCAHKGIFKKDPVRLIRCFRYCQQYGVAPDFKLTQLIRTSLPLVSQYLLKNEDASTAFKAILQDVGRVYPALHAMHEHGVLGSFIPEFGKLTCLVQHEYYHRYTTDVHTLNTLRILDQVASDTTSPYRKALHATNNPYLLYWILLLHDIGKACGISGHESTGAALAKPILERFGIETESKRQILFVIEHHLLMARFWQKHDIEDPNTARTFAQDIGSEEILHYLYVHTYCDAKGTVHGLWNHHKEALHSRLYQATLDVFRHTEGTPATNRKDAFYARLIEKQELTKASREEIEAHFETLPEHYFANKRLEGIILHLNMVNDFLKQILQSGAIHPLAPIIHWENDLNQNLTIVNVATWDRAGLFYKLAGALTVAGLTILTTKTVTRADDIALDTFIVAKPEGGAANDPSIKKAFEQALHSTLLDGEDLQGSIKKIAKKTRTLLSRSAPHLHVELEPMAEAYYDESLKRIIVHIETKDRLGLLYDLGKVFFDFGLNITFGRILTESGVAADTFHLEPSDTRRKAQSLDLTSLKHSINRALNT